MKILAIGDVVSKSGVDMIRRSLSGVIRLYGADFTIVNGENTCGTGISPDDAETLYRAGADAITLGNHAFRRHEIKEYMDSCPYLLRPLNFSPRAPGCGYKIFDVNGVKIKVINLIGRCFMDFLPDNPFHAADRAISDGSADITVVDFHAQATSEKEAMGFYLDGRVSAVYGTHTHVQTADEKVLEGGTGYISDIGMTGAYRSVLGVKPEHSVAMFLGELPARLEGASGRAYMCGAYFDIDETNGKCRSVERVSVID